MKFHRKNAIRGGGLNLWLIIHLSRGEGDRKAFWEKKNDQDLLEVHERFKNR